MTAPPLPQIDQDAEHLKLLSIFHYVVGGMAALFACIPVIHVILGILLLAMPDKFGHGHDQPPAFVGLLFIIIGGFIILLGWTLGGIIIVTGRSIAQRKRYTFCFVIACIECLFMPVGTVLGVFTILVLNRPSVKQLFA